MRELCPVCEKKQLVVYVTSKGEYRCCNHCHFEYVSEVKRDDSKKVC